MSELGDHLERHVTAERKEHNLLRREVAEVLGGMPEYCPWPWDGSDDELVGLSTIPFERWPIQMREERYSQWRIRRDDFAEWYRAWQLRTTARLNRRPARTNTAKDRSDLTPSFAKIQEAIDAELAAGGRLDGLRPRERNPALSQLMHRGYKSKKLPTSEPTESSSTGARQNGKARLSRFRRWHATPLLIHHHRASPLHPCATERTRM